MLLASPALAPDPGSPVWASRGGRGLLLALRVVLLAAAAVLAYAVLSALDGESALADDGRTRGRAGNGLLATTLDRTAAAVPPIGGLSVPEAPRKLPAALAPRAAPGVVATVGKVTVPVTTRTKTVTERAVAITRNVKPARNLPRPHTLPAHIPPAHTPDPPGVVPDAVSDVVGVVPEVVGTVPDLVAVVPRVIGLVPETVPGVIGVIPGVIDTLPQVVAPLLPSVPLPPETSVMMPPAARAAVPSPATSAVGATIAVPDRSHSTSVPRYRSSAAAAIPLAAAGFGPGSAPADPPTNKPLIGAQQAGGATGGSGHPHAVPAASAASGGYRFLVTRLSAETDRAGCIPSVPALPG